MKLLVLVIMLALALAACGTAADRSVSSLTPSPALKGQSALTESTPEDAASIPVATPTVGPEATPIVSTGDVPADTVEEVPPDAGEEGPPDVEEPPDEGFPPEVVEYGSDTGARQFVKHLQDAISALRKVPSYRYTVTDSASGLILVGVVNSSDERSWTVSQTGFPDRVLARWLLTQGKVYTDVSGTWEVLEEAPFDTESSISYAPSEDELMFRYFPGKLRTRTTTVDGRRATLYELERRFDDGSSMADRLCELDPNV